MLYVADATFKWKLKPPEKPYSHISDCLTLAFSAVLVSIYFWLGSFNEGKRMTRSPGSSVSRIYRVVNGWEQV